MTELRQHNIIWSSLTPYTSPVTDWYLIDVTTLLKIHSPPTICLCMRLRIQSICSIQRCTGPWGWHTIYSYSSWSRSCYSWYTTRSNESSGLSGWFTSSYIHSSFCTSYKQLVDRELPGLTAADINKKCTPYHTDRISSGYFHEQQLIVFFTDNAAIIVQFLNVKCVPLCV